MTVADPPPARLDRTQEYLKQIVYGGNDGIVTTFAIVAGFAGANAEGAAGIGTLAILVFGLANLFADGVSMGLGEFLSARSKRDLYDAELARARALIRSDRPAAEERLTRAFAAKGLSPHNARAAAAAIVNDSAASAEILLGFEMGLSDPQAERAGAEGMVTFMAFLAFGFLPLLPYFVLPAAPMTQWISAGATGTALILLGLLRWHATGESLGRSVGETVLVGGLCSGVAFAVGALVGAA